MFINHSLRRAHSKLGRIALRCNTAAGNRINVETTAPWRTLRGVPGGGQPCAAVHIPQQHSSSNSSSIVRPCYNLLLASMRCIRQHTAAAAAKGLFPTLSKCAHSSEAETTASVHVSVCAAVLTGTDSTGAESRFFLGQPFPKSSHGRFPFTCFSISLNDAQHPAIGPGGSSPGRYATHVATSKRHGHPRRGEKIGVAGRIHRRQQNLGPSSGCPTPCCFVAAHLVRCTRPCHVGARPGRV